MDEIPQLEDIVEDFIDDVKRKVNVATLSDDVRKANGLVALFHNAYTRIDDDIRCEQFAGGMADWAMDYTKGTKEETRVVQNVNRLHYFAPTVYFGMGGLVMVNAVTALFSDAPTSAGMIGVGISGLLLTFGVKSIMRIRKEKQGVSTTETVAIKPYAKWFGDLKRAPPEAIRGALLAKKEHAYANLNLVPQIPTL